MEKNKNICNFARELSELIDEEIGVNHIHPSEKGRYFYIQAPKVGAPMLLHHYRGPFFVDMHPDDFFNLVSGKVSAHDYITSANWQVGYFRGGGSMFGGGYYQPIDIIGRKEEVRRYLRILSCRGSRSATGHMPSEDTCQKCPVNNCPFSLFKNGNWSEEMSEHDPRFDLFKALYERLNQEKPGYILRGLLCGEIPDNEIWINPKVHWAYASSSVIRALLMHETVPENWEEYAKSFKFIRKVF